jgi:acetolactate decarboxylase
MLFIIPACTATPEQSGTEETVIKHDKIYHYSVLKALDNGVLEGTMIPSELLEHGDFGLGTYNGLNGEMVVLDQRVNRIAPSGEVVEASNDIRIPYTIVCFFEPEKTISVSGKENLDYNSLVSMIDTVLPSQNLFYAFRITGEFKHIKCGGADRQEKPFDKTILEMLADRPLYEKENVRGTLVGFWCPDYIGDINTSGFHLHFLSDDRSMGGHLLAFEASSLKIEYDVKNGYEILLPDTESFRNARFRESAVNY